MAVVIPCRNEAPTLGSLLDAVAHQSVAPTEVIVVDDGSTDASRMVLGAWSLANPALPLRVVSNPRRGVASALNVGISAATATCIVRLDAHCVPCRDYVRWSIAGLNHPGVAVVGGWWRIEPGADTEVARAIAAVVAAPLGAGGARYRRPGGPGAAIESVETVPFGAFKRSTWALLGGFDETLHANEDFDFNYRVRRRGLLVALDRRIHATYFARPTLPALARQYFRYGFYKCRMLRKQPASLHPRQVAPISCLPWLVGTTLWCVLAPDPISILTVALYPVAVVGGGRLAVRANRASWRWACAAGLSVHLAWSAGFWASFASGLTRRPPVAGQG